MHFKFNGIGSYEMGITVNKQPTFTKSMRRTDITEVPGRDGAITEFNAYSTYVLTMDLTVEGTPDDLDMIGGWLNGYGVFERDDYPGKIMNVEIQSDIIFTYLVDGIYQAPLNIYVYDPFWYKKADDWVTLISAGTVQTGIVSEGNVDASPIIRINKNTQLVSDITINGIRLTYTFANNENYVEIDCQKKTSRYEGLPRDRMLSIAWDYPKILKNGATNSVTNNSGDATIQIKRKDKWR